MLHISSLTDAEAVRINGTLPIDRLEVLVERGEALQEIIDSVPCLEDARVSYPAEDFLSEIYGDLSTLAKSMRGSNRAALLAIVERLEALELETHNASEYGRDEMRKVFKAIEAAA